MFISKKEAEERLRSTENLLGDTSGAHSESVDGSHAPLPGGGETEEVEDVDDEPSVELISHINKLDEILDPQRRGRGAKLNRGVQSAIGEMDVMLGPKATSALTGLGVTQVSAYGEGRASANYDRGHVPEVKKSVDELKEKIALAASKRLMTTIKSLDKNKIAAIESPLEAGRLAKDLATVVDKMEKKGTDQGQGIHFHIFHPPVKKLGDYAPPINVTPRKVASDESNA